MKDHSDDRAIQRDLLTLKNIGLIIQKGGSKNIIWTLHHSTTS